MESAVRRRLPPRPCSGHRCVVHPILVAAFLRLRVVDCGRSVNSVVDTVSRSGVGWVPGWQCVSRRGSRRPVVTLVCRKLCAERSDFVVGVHNAVGGVRRSGAVRPAASKAHHRHAAVRTGAAFPQVHVCARCPTAPAFEHTITTV